MEQVERQKRRVDDAVHELAFDLIGRKERRQTLSTIPEPGLRDSSQEQDGYRDRRDQIQRELDASTISDRSSPEIDPDHESRKRAREQRQRERIHREQHPDLQQNKTERSTAATASSLARVDHTEGDSGEPSQEDEVQTQAVQPDASLPRSPHPLASEIPHSLSSSTTPKILGFTDTSMGDATGESALAGRASVATSKTQQVTDNNVLSEAPQEITEDDPMSAVDKRTGDACESVSSLTDSHTATLSYAVSGQNSTLPTSLDLINQPCRPDEQRTGIRIAASVADPGLDAETSAKLTSLFVDDFLANLRSTPGLIRELAESAHNAANLIREYARLKATAASTSVEEIAASVVRYRRHDIAANIKSIATTLPSQDGVLSLADKLALLWAKDRPDRPDDFEYLAADDDLDDILPELLREQDVREALTFLFASEEYQWLLERMKLETMMSTTQSTYTLVRERLIDVQANASTTTLQLDWSPRMFIDQQFGESTEIGSTICLVGDESSAYATTCRGYIDLMWPQIGPYVLDLMATAITGGQDDFSDTIGGAHAFSVSFGHGSTVVNIAGPAVLRLEASEVLVWLAAACQSSSSETMLSTCMPTIQKASGNVSNVAYALSPLFDPAETIGLCWLRMFGNPVMVLGYPIPRRSAVEVGLEVPLAMMAELGQAVDVVNFSNTTIIKGFASLFVPTISTATSVVWHFMLSPDGSRVSYNTGADATGISKHLEPEQLQTARHFVGWTATADQLTVLLYICSSWLYKHKQRLQLEVMANQEDENESTKEAEGVIGAIDHFRHPLTLEGKASAISALYNRTNRNLKLSKTVESKIEVVNGQSSQKDTTTWTTWQSNVEEKFSSLEIVFDHIVRSRLSQTTRDVKMPFRSGTFEGYEFNDVVSGTSTLQPHEVSLLPNADDWLKWCCQGQIIPLMGSDFGELVRPTNPPPGAHNQSCGKYALCPTNLDYLAAPVSILRSLNDRISSPTDGSIMLDQSCVWRRPVSSFRPCRCKCDGICEVDVTKLNDRSQRSKKHTSADDPDMIWTEYGRGAVIFGSIRNRLTKMHDDLDGQLAVPTPPKLRRSKATISDSGIDVGSSSSLGSSDPSGTKSPQTSESGLSLETHSSSSSHQYQQRQQTATMQERSSQTPVHYTPGLKSPRTGGQAHGGAEKR
ncbi:hypothetical protein LTR78_001153 [Recurvomyces mirabilis]|uniref:Uncharacterized protein n=1 Tax=Recurvomyces mirabilis TaxID=574656 RepID=A0AAE0WVM2_9PEZI|nr:hypothetical protein LTR78_001153 [Recurvomyces mirabilis]KAK5161129.1 hypothetical protein LTS14_000925 [Recurvomyces mirabilis]